MRPFRRSAALIAVSAALCAGAAACGDAPTLPTSFAQQAGGRTWVAVTPPAGMPGVRTWMAYAPREAATRVRSLEQQAARARRAGMLETALEMDGQAARLAATSVSADPPAPRVYGAVSAVREWETRAGERLRAGRYPDLERALAAVAAARAEAEAALARGETRAAVLRLADAAGAAREFAPEAVALRLIADAERRAGADPEPGPEMRRARLLLRLSREALATGDQTRAMKRAWYALQIVDGRDGSASR
ncbi:hypothetical protein [Longimicrobium sp.]|uniref:hypothetical protein n=1 Tax=Longimicrobium sp. TaxID=2029185 RepID=UPI002BA76999|nr:hypothetical protein [Longimicrobium sp.]HSU13612.1 hypothetical protein [Longimicrobium sp.]